MDFGISEESKMIQTALRKFVKEECIPVEQIRRYTVEFLGHVRHDMLVKEGVFSIEKLEHLTGGAGNALVHGIEDSLVVLGDELADTAFVALHYRERGIGGIAVDYDVLDIRIGLAENALNRGFHRGFSVPAYGYDRKLHGSNRRVSSVSGSVILRKTNHIATGR